MKKTSKIGLVILVVALLLGVCTLKGQQLLDMEAQLFVASGPAPTSGSFPLFRNNGVAFLEAEGTLAPRASGPTAYMPLKGQTGEGDFTYSTTTNLWRLEFGPGGSFTNERGNYIWGSLRLRSPVKFRLANLTGRITSSDYWNALGYTNVFSDDSYSLSKKGKIYPVAGFPNSPHNVEVTSGSPLQLVDELDYIGVGNAFLANTPSQAANNSAYVDGYLPFYITFEYWLRDDDGNLMVYITKTVSTLPPQGSTFPVPIMGFSYNHPLATIWFTNGQLNRAYGIDGSIDLVNWVRITDMPFGNYVDQYGYTHKFFRGVVLDLDPGTPRSSSSSLSWAGKFSGQNLFTPPPSSGGSNGDEL